MSKSILVIDTPPHCMDCPIATMIKDKARDKWVAHCYPCGKVNELTMTKPEWCPLKPMPNIRGGDRWAMGWNACLREIEKNDK